MSDSKEKMKIFLDILDYRAIIVNPHDLLGEDDGEDDPQLFPEELLELEEDRKPEELELGLEDEDEDEDELDDEPEERP